MVLSAPGTENLANPGIMESATGFEPALSVWKTDVLTIKHYADIKEPPARSTDGPVFENQCCEKSGKTNTDYQIVLIIHRT